MDTDEQLEDKTCVGTEGTMYEESWVKTRHSRYKLLNKDAQCQMWSTTITAPHVVDVALTTVVILGECEYFEMK